MEPKRFASAISQNADWRAALKEACKKAKKDLDGRTCDLALVFVSEAYSNFNPKSFVKELSDHFPYRVLLGCNSSGVIGDDVEVEMEPALSMLAMHLPGVRINPFYIPGDGAHSIQSGSDLINFFDVFPTDTPRFLCLVDPASVDIMNFLDLFNDAYKNLPVVGGLASGGMMNAANWLCLGGQVYTEGLVGVAMMGEVSFEIVVSQGCRPIGKPYVITRAEDNVLYELAGRSALEVVRDLMEELSAKDKSLAEHSLSVGLAMTEQKSHFRRGDFLIRNIVGFDPDSGALMVGAHLKVGQTLQFQVRDAQTSAEELRHGLGALSDSNGVPRGAFLVSCCGRGKNFYGVPHHDARAVQSARGPMPLCGFFANGEIGPIGQKNFVHGYTSSLVIVK